MNIYFVKNKKCKIDQVTSSNVDKYAYLLQFGLLYAINVYVINILLI